MAQEKRLSFGCWLMKSNPISARSSEQTDCVLSTLTSIGLFFLQISLLKKPCHPTVILSYLTPQQGAKKTAQLQRWVDRMIKDGDVVINEFSKTYNAAERHTIRQHVLRIHRDMKQQADEEQLKASRLKLFNYIQQVALISDN